MSEKAIRELIGAPVGGIESTDDAAMKLSLAREEIKRAEQAQMKAALDGLNALAQQTGCVFTAEPYIEEGLIKARIVILPRSSNGRQSFPGA